MALTRPERTLALEQLRSQLGEIGALNEHSSAHELIDIVTGETQLAPSGYPTLSDRSFRIFTQYVPHLFSDGQSILEWLAVLESELGHFEADGDALESVTRAIKVLRTVVYTAGVTAPTDLWILKHVLSAHQNLGTLSWLLDGHTIIPEAYGPEHGLEVDQLRSDLHFLHARGYLNKGDDDFSGPHMEEIAAILREVQPIENHFNVDMVPVLVDWLSGGRQYAENEEFLKAWLKVDAEKFTTGSWIANLHQIELGYRLVPLVIALRLLDITESLTLGARINELDVNLMPELEALMCNAGLVCEGVVTQLGARVFERGPGPFGIIGAYHGYLMNREALLDATADVKIWVQRGENVIASQDANAKTFKMANDQLDKFCEDYSYTYNIFIEHAVGQGEAIRQRFERDDKGDLRYFGADLEPKAIEKAKVQQREGLLPQNLEFICPADIGEPSKVIEYLKSQGLENEPTVLMVGNGFHEIRNQTNEKMIEVFRQYQEAGYVCIFTEESALNDEALLQTAWNTYHAGFRYVHELSGQGLRPARGTGLKSDRWSWRRCASLGGYLVLDEYSFGTRTIYPYPRPVDKNPSISETFFCLPYKLGLELGIEIEGD